MKFQMLLLGFALYLAGSLVQAQSVAQEQDAQVVESLRKNGSDFSKLHLVDYFMVLPTEATAKMAAAEMNKAGYSVAGIAIQSNGRMWEVHAQRSQLVQLKAMQETTAVLTNLAKKFGGYYDGWGAVSVK